MDLQVHTGLRFLRWHGAMAEPLASCTSVLAGSRYSNIYARMFLYEVLDVFHSQATVHIGLHVDGLATTAFGTPLEATKSICDAVGFLSHEVAVLKLTISPKTVIVSSAAGAGKVVQSKLAEHGVFADVALRARDLGFDAAAGRRRATAVLSARLSKAAKRVRKLKIISRINAKAKSLWQQTSGLPLSSRLRAWGSRLRASISCGPVAIALLCKREAAALPPLLRLP